MKEPSNSKAPPNTRTKLGVGSAILRGHLVVSLPSLLVFAATYGLGELIGFAIKDMGLATQSNPLLIVRVPFLLGAFISSWVWWSIFVPRWRRWALRNGAPAEQLHRWAVRTGLEWPKGVIFEKTELDRDE